MIRSLTMTKKPIFPLFVLALALAGPGFGQQAQGTMSVSLEDCIVRALKDNLGVAIQVLGPEISSESVNAAQAKYIPTLSMSLSSRKSENASYSYLDATESLVDKTQNFTFMNASQALPTGGSFTLDFNGYRTSTNRRGTTIDPRYSTTLLFRLTQPLLRNFGFKMARREILVAANNLGISEESLKKTLITPSTTSRAPIEPVYSTRI
jgi:hypothetical protein